MTSQTCVVGGPQSRNLPTVRRKLFSDGTSAQEDQRDQTQTHVQKELITLMRFVSGAQRRRQRLIMHDAAEGKFMKEEDSTLQTKGTVRRNLTREELLSSFPAGPSCLPTLPKPKLTK